MAVAFFDLDLTLLAVNSASLWLRREYRAGNLSTAGLLRGGLWVLAYQAGFARMEPLIEEAIAQLAGVDEKSIAERTAAFWEEEVQSLLRPGAHAAVQHHRDLGDRLVLLTSSSPYLSELARAAFDLDFVLCNRFEVKDGVFTGKPELPLCFGPGKLVHARRYVDTLGVALSDCAFYTDSFSDRAVLDEVGTPVCVHPDRRLRRYAAQRGWPVVDWGAPPPVQPRPERSTP